MSSCSRAATRTTSATQVSARMRSCGPAQPRTTHSSRRAGPDAEPNWLAGALDPQIGRALSAIHRDPGHDWTVEELARACHLSRSAFAARFVARVGKPPATYLAHVRLDAATGLLRDTTLPVTLIAENVGYTSEAAFSRAFKNRYGTPPARWRRDTRAS